MTISPSRFSNRSWSEWPLTVDKYVKWLDSDQGELINLFIDYETFGEHQWADTGIFDFLKALPAAWLKKRGHKFMTITEAAESDKPADALDIPYTTTWADSERDLSAWLGQPHATGGAALYLLVSPISHGHWRY